MALSVEDLYTAYTGRAPDEGGLAYWKEQFGNTIDPNEALLFQQAAAANQETAAPAGTAEILDLYQQ